MLIGRNCTLLSGPTIATRGPSARNNIVFTGIVTLFTPEPTAKCTSPNEPGSKRPSLFGTSTSVRRVRVVGSMDSAVRATAAENFWPGNSCRVTKVLAPTFTYGAYAWGTLV